eukprot:CAMPEP_0177643350 /NCGR_PEP_ID=MMETSP0447-20121125/8109_1 /TAXON_ID=0 /ORGANISM="Stygamoeba regulata, Strain BSH-02190019" /LENGTH=393 /DNA_ID=CAMNT_0019145641 /DNA_START=208 /DNA_END=1389 /DNA_ORIENTATION=-
MAAVPTAASTSAATTDSIFDGFEANWRAVELAKDSGEEYLTTSACVIRSSKAGRYFLVGGFCKSGHPHRMASLELVLDPLDGLLSAHWTTSKHAIPIGKQAVGVVDRSSGMVQCFHGHPLATVLSKGYTFSEDDQQGQKKLDADGPVAELSEAASFADKAATEMEMSANMPYCNNCAVAELAGKWYLFGGNDLGNRGMLNTLSVYDPSTCTLTDVEMANRALVPPREYLSCAVLGTRLYVFGGWLGGSYEDVTKYDDRFFFVDLAAAAPEWKELLPTDEQQPWPCARSNFAMTGWDDRYVLGFGGYDPRVGELNDLWVYDTETHHWTEIPASSTADTPAPRWGHHLLVYENALVVYGGEGGWRDGRSVPLKSLHYLTLPCPTTSTLVKAVRSP